MVLGNNICILDKVALICIKLPYPSLSANIALFANYKNILLSAKTFHTK